MHKNVILTPTYVKHFGYVKKYLLSFSKYVLDASEIPIYFVISNEENDQFTKIVKPFRNKLKINVIFFEDILEEFNISLSEDFLKKIGMYRHYSYQTLKKMYSILYINAERFLILDSETMWIKSVNMNQVFEDYFKNPYLVGEDIVSRERYSEFQKREDEGVEFILGRPCTKCFVEHFGWFYTKQIVEDLCEKYGSPIDMVKVVYQAEIKKRGSTFGLMEWPLLHNYIYDNLEKYGFRYIDVNEQLDIYFMQDTKKDYLERFYKKYNGTCGIIEMALAIVNERTYLQMADLFRDNKLFIIRCPETNGRLYKFQRRFLIRANTCILAADQDHIFGINGTVRSYMKKIVLPGLKTGLWSELQKRVKKVLRVISPAYRVSLRLEDEIAQLFDYINGVSSRLYRHVDNETKRNSLAAFERNQVLFWLAANNNGTDIEKYRKKFWKEFPKCTTDLRFVQLIGKYLLESLKKICDSCGVKFFLQEGTLLGAVRHGGFVPWDDDVDVGMMRGDFQKLCDFVKESTEFKIEITYNFRSKCRMSKFMSVREDIPFFVDIFLYDTYRGENVKEAWEEIQRVRKVCIEDLYVRNINNFSQVYNDVPIRNEKDLQIGETIYSEYLSMLNPVSEEDNFVYWAIENYQISPQNRVYEIKKFFPLSTMYFEGTEYYVPGNTEECLKRRYGDYLSVPQDAFKQRHIGKFDSQIDVVKDFLNEKE